MKRKVVMKFMAVLLSASMIAGSGIPAAAANISPQSVGVQTGEMLLAEDAEAAAYLKKYYVEDNWIITNGGTGVTKSEDGLSYSVGLKSTSGTAISSIFLRKATSPYKTGWYIDSEWANTSAKKPASLGSAAIKRPTAEEGPQTFKATLRLFPADTSDDVINDETQAAAAAVASQEFTITLEAADPVYTMNIKVQDEDGTEIPDATVKLEKDWSTVQPGSDGSYIMEKGGSYTLTVSKTGYNDYKENITFNPTTTKTEKVVTLKKQVTKNVKFAVTEKGSGKTVENPTITVKQGYYTTIKPESDGSYNLIEGTSYNYTVTATNYNQVSGSFTAGSDATINVELEKNISKYKVFLKPVGPDGTTAVANASVTVTYEEEDDWGDTDTVTLKPESDGSYTMDKNTTYTYTITADGYQTATASYKPSGSEEEITLPITMQKDAVDEKDQETVDSIKALFDKEGTFRPNYATDKNILDLVKAKISGYTDLETNGVTVRIKSSSDADVIAADGKIAYNKAVTLNNYGMNFINVGVVYIIEKNGAIAETKESTATIGWERDYYNTRILSEKNDFVWDNIKGANTEQTEVTADLTLPQIVTASARTSWSQITWTSSNPDVISIDNTGYNAITDPKKGTIHAQPEDKEVTLTATFQANDSTLNSNVEKVSDFATYTKEFKVTVKGTGALKPTEEELQAILDKHYTADQIQDFDSKEVADLANCKGDLQLPRYTRIQDEQGEYVFANKEITVTSDSDAMTINGYRAAIDRFAANEDMTVNLIVTFTRDGITVSKKIPVTIKPITEADVQDELDLMEQVKAHYFDGLNDGVYEDKDSVTGNLHPFQEAILGEDGNLKWIYNNANKTDQGIIPDDMFDDPWEMEGAGYNKFKSSNNAVVAHENLVVTRRENDTQITISSVLSSERYGSYAEKYPDNKVLQKLYKQPVSVTITVKGTKTAIDGLADVITEAEAFYESMTEGTEAGQYPAGTKDALKAAIAQAKDVQNKENLTEKEASDALVALEAAVKTAKDAENTAVAHVTIYVNKIANQPGENKEVTVTAKDAEKYGYEKPEASKNQVTVADALYKLHEELYGEDFAKDPSQYLQIGSNGWITAVFGTQTSNLMYYVNNKYVADYANAAVLSDGDVVNLFLINDTTNWSDRYLYFEGIPASVEAGKQFQVTVKSADYNGNRAEANCTVTLKNTKTGKTVTAVTDKNGAAVLKADKAGTYQIYVSASPYEYFVVPSAQLEVKAQNKPVNPEKPKPPIVTPKPVVKQKVMMAKAVGGKKSVTLAWSKVKGAKNYKIYAAKCGGKYKDVKTVSAKNTKWTQKGLKKATAYKYYVVAYGKDGKIGKSVTAHVHTAGSKYGTVKSITIKKDTVALKKGKTATVKATVKGNGKKLAGHVNKVRFVSSDKTIATVSTSGTIKAKKKGTCYVYCYAENGKYAKVKVTVK